MEVEVKLRLPDAAAHAALAAALAPGFRRTLQQENYFFDGPSQELTSKRVVLRVRFYDEDAKAVITVKVGGRAGVEGAGVVRPGRAAPAPFAQALKRTHAHPHATGRASRCCRTALGARQRRRRMWTLPPRVQLWQTPLRSSPSPLRCSSG